jgi:hypothetical protein
MKSFRAERSKPFSAARQQQWKFRAGWRPAPNIYFSVQIERALICAIIQILTLLSNGHRLGHGSRKV